jgi:hypothetical protein
MVPEKAYGADSTAIFFEVGAAGPKSLQRRFQRLRLSKQSVDVVY